MKINRPLVQEVHTCNKIGCTYTISSIKSLPLHMHHAYEIVFILEGNVDFTCTSFSYHLSEGDIFIANVNELHSLHSDDGNNLVLTFYFNPYDYSNTFPHLSYYWFFCDSYSTDSKDSVVLKHFQSMLFKAVYLLSSYDENSPQQAHEIKAFTSDIINFMINNYQNISFYEKSSIKKNLKSGDDLAMKRIFEIQEYIYLNFEEKISLDDISKHLNLNKYYVSRLIKSFLGLNLTEFLGLIRTEKAEIKLLSTNSSIDQIAYECGFSSVSYLEKHFIKWNKMKPYEYRKAKIKEISEDRESVMYFDISDERVRSAEDRLLTTPVNKPRQVNDYYASIPMDSEGDFFPHPWERYINISDINTTIQLLDKISLGECKKDLKFDTIRIINIVDSFVNLEAKNTFFERGLISFFNDLIRHGIHVEFYFLPSIENADDILKSLSSFLNLLSDNYEDINAMGWSFVINTIHFEKHNDTSCFSKKIKYLLSKYHIRDLTIISESFDTELYTYDSMKLVPRILTSASDIHNNSYHINYRELFDIPSKNINSPAAFARNGLFGLFGEKKPIYHAWSMLSQLGDSILLQEEGLIATKRGNDYYILLFDPESTITPPDNTFSTNIQFSLNVKTTYQYTYNLIELTLDSSCSLFEKLNDIHFPEKLTKKDVKYLNLYTSPKISISFFNPKECNILNINLNPYSAKLIILEKR